jgi:hypothetical protein
MTLFKKLSVLFGLIVIFGMAPLAFAQDPAAPAQETAAPAPAPAQKTAAPAPVSAAPVNRNFDEDWKITVNGKAKSAGAISFRVIFAPSYDGSPGPEKFIEVLVSEGTSENDAADMIGNAFQVILGEDDFNIKVSWGENIKIEAKDDTPDFVLELASSSVQGLSIEVEG